VTLHYVDASAWAKLLVDEPESDALVAWVDQRLEAQDQLVSSHLLVTELHRLASRVGACAVDVSAALGVVNLALPDPTTFRTAGLLPGPLRSLDALHVASALELGAESFVSYDEQQLSAAESVGIRTQSPA
jgi:predicted nucleic acid-binding protein